MKGKMIILLALTLLFPSTLHARLPISRLMNLYDPNTELILEGKALKNFRSKDLKADHPAVVPMALGNRTIFVILGPPWYIRKLGISVKKGQKIQVIGSKVYGPRGRIYIIARKVIIPKKDRSYTLRDESYIPYWRGKGISPSTPRSIVKPAAPSFPAFFGRGKRGGHHHR
ncbi:MAG: hypothetical protein DRI91_04135 [Aquificota bacterium]|nr:MAG: hypothetical protein DRI91_04135 [Aquificota bacterium]